ncbi:MAG TPA: TonB-dependent receptor [Terriglobales bacterium]|nr:TonB-dependent receptor [Terriglobales bacterium]
MKLCNLLGNVALGLLLLTGMGYAQGVGASGDITGTVTDPSGAVLTNATVTATEAEKGIKRTASPNSTGQYRLAGLSPAIYDVSVTASGFQGQVEKGIVVNVGETVVLDFHLKVSTAGESVEVTTEPPVVETERGHQADTVNQQLITDLPIDRRDYLTYTLLMPGVNDSTRLASDHEFRVKQTPQSGLSFYGSNGRGNTVTIDGGEANDDAGGVRLTLSQDAVKEFQINRSNYSAELGSASGASINIVSQSGTNNLHGSLYGFFRNDMFDARDRFAISSALKPGQLSAATGFSTTAVGKPVKESLNRQQFGATLGFPLQKDKSFVFLSFEGLRDHRQTAVPLLTNSGIFAPDNGVLTQNNQIAIINGLSAEGGTPVPCLTGQPALPAAVCAGILQNVLTINPATSPRNSFLVNQFETNGGVFPFNTEEYLASGRWDHQFSDRNLLYLRYSYGRDREANPDVTSLTGISRGSGVRSLDHTLQAAWFHQFSPNTLNEARAQASYSNFNVIPNVNGGPGFDLPGYASLGTNIFLASLTIMRRYEFADNVTMIRGNHTMKFGAYELLRGNHTESHTFLPGRFQFSQLPGGILSPCLQVPAACGLVGVNPATLNGLQSFSFGLPSFYQQGFVDPAIGPIDANTRPLTAFYWQDTWKAFPNVTFNFGLRYEVDKQYGTVSTDKDNFAPRFSFAWDPFSDHKTVIRAGYGIFYSPVYYQIPNVAKTLGNINNHRQIANLLIPLTGAPGNPALTSAAVFQTLFAQGVFGCTNAVAPNQACITPAMLAQFGISTSNTGPLPPLTVLFSAQPNYPSPYSQQASLGVERELLPGLSVSASYIYVHTIQLPVAIDTNLLPAPLVSRTLGNGQMVTFRNWGAPQCAVAVNNPCFANPVILQNNVYSSLGSAGYNGGILEIKKRFSHHFTMMANYTYSKGIDTTTDFNSDFSPFDETGSMRPERSVSDFDQRHKLVVAGVLETPWKNDCADLADCIFGGFSIAPIVRYNSSHPFNLLAGADVNNDRHPTNDRPIGAPRNSGIGPDFLTFDMRIARRIPLGERFAVQLIAEGFNLFNRSNFASVNNTVGPSFSTVPTFTTFNVQGSKSLSPTTPLGFTSLQPLDGWRQLQFGVRLTF